MTSKVEPKKSSSQLCLDLYIESLADPRPHQGPCAYNSADIRLYLDDTPVGIAQQMNHQVKRDKVPACHLLLESLEPEAFSRGKRGIAGTLLKLNLLGADIELQPPESPLHSARHQDRRSVHQNLKNRFRRIAIQAVLDSNS